MDYQEILERKKVRRVETGFVQDELNPVLFDFQQYCVRRMLRVGKGAIFAGCGLGKTLFDF